MSDAGLPQLGLRRDRPETPFSQILQQTLQAHTGAIAAVFVDAEGECIDYATLGDPFEAKVIGATLLETSMAVVRSSARAGAGAALLWVLEAERLEFVVRRVTDEHLVVVCLRAGALTSTVLRGMGPLAEALRREAALPTPAWDPEGDVFEVETRAAKGWGYAPLRARQRDRALGTLDVLGRWTEHGSMSAQEVVCFRVRSADEELTLVHDPALDRWYRR